MRLRIPPFLGLLGAALLAVAGVLAVPRAALSVAAASTGVVVGQVVWCAPLPVPYGVAPGAFGAEGGAEAIPETVPEGAPEPGPEVLPDRGGVRPVPVPRPGVPRPIPAGAVLVAVQGTSLSARTDEGGRFRIEGVPIGQYLTVAAGPVRGAATAIAIRPNVYLREAGQTFSVGRLSLGQQCAFAGPVPYAVPGAPSMTPDAPGLEPEEGDLP